MPPLSTPPWDRIALNITSFQSSPVNIWHNNKKLVLHYRDVIVHRHNEKLIHPHFHEILHATHGNPSLSRIFSSRIFSTFAFVICCFFTNNETSSSSSVTNWNEWSVIRVWRKYVNNKSRFIANLQLAYLGSVCFDWLSLLRFVNQQIAHSVN